MAKAKRNFLCMSLFLVLCLFAGSAGAEEALTWPVNSDLVSKDANVSTVWHDMGDVSIWNTKDDLKIDIKAAPGFAIAEIAIHIVDDPADFDAVFDKKEGKPKISKFDIRKDYLTDFGIQPLSHQEVIPLANLDVCWGVNPEKCPPNRYIIVFAELLQQQTTVEGTTWVSVGEGAFAKSNSGVFDRFPGSTAAGDAIYWGFYVTYPLAKVEPGHFIDANVNGLTFATPTQFGVTGDEGQFWFIPEERIDFSVGSLPLGDALGDRRVSPLDLFEEADLDDDRVLNVARLLQSLDADGMHDRGSIQITDPVVACVNSAL